MRIDPSRDAPVNRTGDCCPSQSEGCGALIAQPIAVSPLATLLAGHALRDGEIIYLAIKPSRWFIVLSGLRFIASVLILAIAATVIDSRMDSGSRWYYWEAALFLIFGRVTWATLQWMARLYVLTDQRILRIEGVFQVDVFDCPLREVGRVDVVRCTRERLFGLGTIVISRQPENAPAALWQMVCKPVEVQARIADAIERNRRGNSLFAAA